MDKTTTLLLRGASIVVIGLGLITVGLFLKGRNIEVKRINRQGYISVSKYCRATQDTSNDTYFNQTYRECMEARGYNPYNDW